MSRSYLAAAERAAACAAGKGGAMTVRAAGALLVGSTVALAACGGAPTPTHAPRSATSTLVVNARSALVGSAGRTHVISTQRATCIDSFLGDGSYRCFTAADRRGFSFVLDPASLPRGVGRARGSCAPSILRGVRW
jgi:hypothetical protein